MALVEDDELRRRADVGPRVERLQRANLNGHRWVKRALRLHVPRRNTRGGEALVRVADERIHVRKEERALAESDRSAVEFRGHQRLAAAGSELHHDGPRSSGVLRPDASDEVGLECAEAHRVPSRIARVACGVLRYCSPAYQPRPQDFMTGSGEDVRSSRDGSPPEPLVSRYSHGARRRGLPVETDLKTVVIACA